MCEKQELRDKKAAIEAERGAFQHRQRAPLTHMYMFLFVNAFRTDNEKVVIGIPGERGESDGMPLAGTPKQVRTKLMQYVGEKFDEWMAMEPPLYDTSELYNPLEDASLSDDERDEYDKRRHGTKVVEDDSEQETLDTATAQNVPTAQDKTEPSPSLGGETGQSSDVDEGDHLID